MFTALSSHNWFVITQIDHPHPQAAARVNPASSVLACYCGVAAHRLGSLKQALAHLQVGVCMCVWGGCVCNNQVA